MLGLFGLLNVGAQSLSVSEEAMEVTGHNLANVNNPDYTRQSLNIQTAPALQTTIGQEGTGVESTGISQASDALLNNQIRGENSVTSSLTAQQTALENAETYLNETITNNSTGTTSPGGLTADISNLFNAFQGVSTNPTDPTQRQALVSSAQDLASEFNQVSSQLADVHNQINQVIQNGVSSANQDLAQIATLNQQIVIADGQGGSANDLVDQRTAAIKDLASYANVTTTAQLNGAVNISIGGVTMVSGITATDSLETYDAGGGQMLIKAQNAGTPLTLSSGSIEGNITARDGALSNLQTSINTLATQLITNVNSIYSSGYDLNGNTGADFFTGTDASNIAVNSTVVSDPNSIQASGSPTAAGDNSVMLALAQLANNKLPGLNNQTFSQNWAQTVGALGNSISSVNGQLADSSSVTQMLQTQRDSVSGVSIDEEMTNLMQYQKSYQASAELISTINQMLQTVINMKSS